MQSIAWRTHKSIKPADIQGVDLSKFTVLNGQNGFSKSKLIGPVKCVIGDKLESVSQVAIDHLNEDAQRKLAAHQNPNATLPRAMHR